MLNGFSTGGVAGSGGVGDSGNAGNLLLVAFENAAGRELTLVAIDRGSTETSFAIELDSGTLGAVSGYRTSSA